jgi:transglutaminase-like putative cysteine protease
MNAYLAASPYIDHTHAAIQALARQLAADASDDKAIARRCFEYVRDEIRHSWDYRCGPVTCRASDVLAYRSGYCYAKSHLLAALLRANGIPAGLCYQRLSAGDFGPPYCLHGLNAVFLAGYGWYRIDPRGNKSGVDARFDPPYERLAFTPRANESDLPGVWPEPLPSVVEALTRYDTIEQVCEHLPDCAELPELPPANWHR